MELVRLIFLIGSARIFGTSVFDSFLASFYLVSGFGISFLASATYLFESSSAVTSLRA
jgi:hypothetical protein